MPNIRLEMIVPGGDGSARVAGEGSTNKEAFWNLMNAAPIMSAKHRKCGNPNCGGTNVWPGLKKGTRKSDGKEFKQPVWRCHDCGANIGLHTTEDGKQLYAMKDDEWWWPDKQDAQGSEGGNQPSSEKPSGDDVPF